MNYERRYIQYNDLVFDGYEMLGEYDATDVSFKVTTHPRSFGHGSYTPFKSDTVFADEGNVSMTLWLKEKKLPCDKRPFYRDFVIEQLSHHGRLWAVQNNTLVWAYATVTSYSEMVEHYNGKVGIDIDFLLYEGIWHKADKQKTFLHPYDVCSFMDCYDYKEYKPCLEESILDCPGVEIDPQSDEGYIVTYIKEDYRDAFETFEAELDLDQDCAPWDGTETDETAYNFRASSDVDIEVGNREIGNIVGGTFGWNQLVQDHGDEKTLTGDIVSFDDAEEYSTLTSLTVPLEPVQDLNGYDSPWPAGGGKNKLPKGTNRTGGGITFTVQSDGTVIANGTSTAVAFGHGGSFTLPAGTYILSGCPVNTQQLSMDIRNAVGGSGIVSGGDGGGGLTFTLTEETSGVVNIRIPSGVTLNNLVFKPMIRLASETDATYAPYSNICPISGWDEVSATRCGGNFASFNASGTSNGVTFTNTNGVITTSGTATNTAIFNSNVFAVNVGDVLYLEGCPYGGGTSSYRIDIRDGATNTVLASGLAFDIGGGYELTVPSGMTSVKIAIRIATGTNASGLVFKPVICHKSTRSTYPVNLSDTAGTVYGGTLDVVSGELLKRPYYESYNGQSLVGPWVSSMDAYSSGATPTTGAQVVDMGGTGSTYQLTPTEIQTLVGTNNIWSDAGEVTVEYISKYADYTLDNHKYLMRKDGVDSYVTGGTQTLTARQDNLFDLTLMLGNDLADYVYANGTFRDYFPAPYYQYNAGELMSVNTSAHITTGINQWDEEWELGNFDVSSLTWTSGDRVISKNPIRVLPNTRYHMYFPSSMTCVFYNANSEYVSHSSVTGTAYVDTPSEAYTMRFCMFSGYGTEYNNDICISLYNSSDRYLYEPYEENIYPLDSSLTLRGVPLLDTDRMVYNGDTYQYDGTVTRRFAVVDLGTKTWRRDTGQQSQGNYFYTNFPDMAVPQNAQQRRLGVMLKYAQSVSDNDLSIDDKSWLMTSVYNAGQLLLKDSDYSTAADLQAALSGVLFVYPLKTPTTETADSFTLKQIVNEYGTEEYVDHLYEQGERDVAIPVGHVSHYALVCPVNGYDGVDIHITGINVWDETWEQGLLSTSTGLPQNSTAQIRSKDFIIVAPGSEYCLSCPSNGVILFYGRNKEYLRWTAGPTFTAPADTYYIKFYTYNTYGGTYNDDISINYPATETDYHPYIGYVAPVSWESEAGTVYKVSVDLANGTMTVYMVGAEMSTLDVQAGANGTFSIFLNDKAPATAGVIDYASDLFEAQEPVTDAYETVNGLYGLTSSSNVLAIKDANYSYTNRNEFYEFIKGQYVYYTLDEPIVKEFTPYSVPTLDGLNNIFIEGASVSYTSTGVHEEGESCVFEHRPYEPGSRFCCDCDCDKVEKDMALCYHTDDLQDFYRYCSDAGFRIIYDCDAAERFFNLIGQEICVTNCHNGVIAGKIYSETDLPTNGITITLVGKMHNPSVEINGNLNWIAGDYDGRLRIESSGDVYYENDCCSDPLEPDVWQKPSDMDYGWKILPRYNRVIVNLGECCGKACAYFDIDNITI